MPHTRFPSSSSSSSTSTSTSVIQKLKTQIVQTDRVTRKWLHSNSKLLDRATDIFNSVILLFPSAKQTNVQIKTELVSTIISLIRIYSVYPSNSTKTLLLNFITSIQLLLEMAIVSKFPNKQLDVITGIEAAKTSLRLSLLWPKSNFKYIHSDDEVLNNNEEDDEENEGECTCGINSDLLGEDEINLVSVGKGPRTDSSILRVRQNRIHQLNKKSPNQNQCEGGGEGEEDPILEALFVIAYERRSNWLIRLFMPELKCKSCTKTIKLQQPTLTNTITNISNTASNTNPIHILQESAYILRPLLHVLLIRQFGWKSWRAWILSLATDLASRVILKQRDIQDEDESLRVEKRRRLGLLLLYLGRSPLFDLLMRYLINKSMSPIRKIPVIGPMTSSAVSWITLLQQYWFYTSGS